MGVRHAFAGTGPAYRGGWSDLIMDEGFRRACKHGQCAGGPGSRSLTATLSAPGLRVTDAGAKFSWPAAHQSLPQQLRIAHCDTGTMTPFQHLRNGMRRRAGLHRWPLRSLPFKRPWRKIAQSNAVSSRTPRPFLVQSLKIASAVNRLLGEPALVTATCGACLGGTRTLVLYDRRACRC
jgi:hypothetical protein